MQFMDAVKHVFSNYATFSGRARRSEFWQYEAFLLLVAFILGIITSRSEGFGKMLSSLWGIAVCIPTLAVTWRRLHDTGRSGLWALIRIIPLIGILILLVFLCQDTQRGSNRYGPDPKYY